MCAIFIAHIVNDYILFLFEEGCSCLRISRRFGVSHTSVSPMVQRYRNTGEHLRRPSHVTTEVQYRYLRLSTEVCNS